jgi:hypothetical protein
MANGCENCGYIPSSLHLEGNRWLCSGCYGTPSGTCRLFEYGHENVLDPKGSTAHVREIKTRRLDPVTKTMFHYEPPKKYFFGK